MEKHTSTFNKGLSTEFSKFKQPKGTYTKAENLVRDIQGTIKSEKGTTLLAQIGETLTSPRIMGATTVGDEVVMCVKANEGSLITTLRADNSLSNALFTGNADPGSGTEVVLIEHTIGGTAIDGYDEAYLSIPKTTETNLLEVGDMITVSGMGDNGTYEIRSIQSVGHGAYPTWEIAFTVAWAGTFGATGIATWYVEETQETSIIEVRYKITEAGGTDPEELSFAAAASPLYDLVFRLNGTTVSVDMEHRITGSPGDPIQNEGIIEHRSSSLLLPESMRPLVHTEYFNSDGAVSSGYGFIARSSGTVSFTLLDDEFDTPRQVLFTDTKTYTSAGIAESTIDTPAGDLLNFDFSYPVDIVARKNHLGDTVIYFTDGLNPPRRLNLSDTVTDATFAEATKLFLNPSLPRIGDTPVLEGGGLTTGLYKFAARLGTSEGNTTTFSQISHGVPLTDDALGAGRDQYDGAEPNTPAGKSIVINVSNIDTSYTFLEIAVITYLGEENLLVSHIIGKVPITSTSLTYTYYSETQKLEEVLLEALVENSIEYATAKHILQKDNHLFLSNLTSIDYSFIDQELQNVADSITAHYFIKEETQAIDPIVTVQTTGDQGNDIEWTHAGYTKESNRGFAYDTLTVDQVVDTNTNNYKHPDYTTKYKGYQRDEVYSFALVPIFNGGIYGSAYHIPGWAANPTDANREGSESSDRLRGWVNSDGTVHHRMPSTAKTPAVYVNEILVTIPASVQVRYNILGVEFREVDLSSSSLTAALEGYVIVRQRRNKPGNGIVVAQGLAKEFYEGKDNGLNPIPFNGKTSVHYDTSKEWQGSNYFFGNLENGTHSVVGGDPRVSNDVSNKGYFAAYCPDILHGIVDNSYLGAMDSVKQIAIKSIRRRADNSHNFPGQTVDMMGAFYQDYEDLDWDVTATDLSALHVPMALDGSAGQIIEPFESSAGKRSINLSGETLQMVGTTGMTVMKMKTGVLPREYKKYPGAKSFVGTGAENRDRYRYTQPSSLAWFFDFNLTMDVENSGHWTLYGGAETTEIYNFYSYLPDIYGSLDTAEYILVDEFYFDEAPSTTIQMFGGDTFISKYAFMIGDIMEISAMNCRATIETYIETRGNYNYRHFVPTTYEGEDTIEGTTPYFPKMNVLHDRTADSSVITEVVKLGLWDYTGAHGSGTSYNKHYNFENTLNKYYPIDNFLEPVSTFPNRIIYSLKSFENEQFDTYRTFLTNNFHDVPKETGEISNIFEYNNVLYAHTAHTLWRTYVNEKTFSNTSSGEVVLGNGGLFPMPSNQIFTEEGGHGGTSAKWACTNTPFGRVFMDDHQEKIFILGSKSNLAEISSPLLVQYFRDNIDSTDNALYSMGYDPLHKRVLVALSKADGGNTLSYSFELQSWTGNHSYGVDKWIQRDNKLIGTLGGRIESIATGIYNSYFGGTYASKLSMVINPDTPTSKDFLNVKWIQTDKDVIFNDIQVVTDDFTTGPVLPIIVNSFADEQSFLPLGQQHVHLVGGEHRMVIPPDNNPDVIYADEIWRPSIKGKYATIELTYLPDVNNIPLELEHFSTEYLKVAE